MNPLLLSSLTKDFLNRDAQFFSQKELYQMEWSGSTIASYPGVSQKNLLLGKILYALKSLFAKEEKALDPLSLSPRLSKPRSTPAGSYRPSRYFSRGSLDQNIRKNPTPLPFLLVETHEISKARPVPGNIPLIRSLCKGKGKLRQSKEGFVYLDVDNRFISTLIPYLKLYGLIRPPYFNLFTEPNGAHIPVIPPRETAFHYLEISDELDKEYSFEIEGLYSIEPASWPEVEQVWFFKLRSPELEKARKKHFLPSLPNGHSFHIAVAIKPRVTVREQPHPLPFMRINTICSPV